MPLGDLRITAAKPKDKPYKLADGAGLYLLVRPTGTKYWRLKYRFNGKEKKLAFGVYPEVSLADARARCMEARKQLAADLDPSEVKRTAKERSAISSANTFEATRLQHAAIALAVQADRTKMSKDEVQARGDTLWDDLINAEMHPAPQFL